MHATGAIGVEAMTGHGVNRMIQRCHWSQEPPAVPNPPRGGEGGYLAVVTRRRGWDGRRVRVPAARAGFPRPVVVPVRPQVGLGAAERRDVVLVNDSQRPPVPGAFVTVTVAPGRGRCRRSRTARPTAAGWCPATRTHRPSRGSTRFHAARVSRASYTAVRDSPVARGEVEAALRPAPGVFEGFVDERGGVAEFPEHRAQRVQFPGLPATRRGPGGDLVGDPELVQVAGQAAVVLDQVDQRVVLVPQRPQVGGDGGVVQPGRDRQGSGAEGDVPGPGFHRGLTHRAQHPAFADAGPVGVPGVLEQAEGGPPGADPLVLGRRSPRSVVDLDR